MLASPWDLILTVLFAATGIWCAVDLIADRNRSGVSDGAFTSHAIIHLNHFVMSIAMILMVWIAVIDAVTWAQAVVFAIFALAFLPDLLAAEAARQKVSLWGHIVLNAAMIWMLLAMPLLMAGITMGGGDSSGHHHGGDGAGLPSATPAWVDLVNVLFVALSVVAAAWWLVALLGRRRHLHDLCYALMAAGMGIMLVVMNA